MLSVTYMKEGRAFKGNLNNAQYDNLKKDPKVVDLRIHPDPQTAERFLCEMTGKPIVNRNILFG